MTTFIKLNIAYNTQVEPEIPHAPMPIWVNVDLITSIQPLLYHQISHAVYKQWNNNRNTYDLKPAPDRIIPYTNISFAAATQEDQCGLNVRETPEQILAKIQLEVDR